MNDGEGGIRTHGGVTPTPVFETGLFNRSSTSPEAERLILAAKTRKMFCYSIFSTDRRGEYEKGSEFCCS
jgi:hypothetical protein